MSYTYLLLDLAVLSIPFIASFKREAPFYKSWPSFFKAMGITAAFFLVWDVIFTKMGVWGFNPNYLVGIDLLGLPVEEWLFFVVVPYACTFTYFAFRYLIKKDPIGMRNRYISLFLFALCIALCITQFGKHYTYFTCLFTAVFLGLHLWKWHVKWISWMYLTYLVILLPFVISNGVLTGLWFYEYPFLHTEPETVLDQVVWYNNDHNLGIRLFSIPIDDILYGFLLVAMNITLFEFFESRRKSTT